MKVPKFLLMGILIVAFSLQANAGDSRSGKETTNASGSTDEYPLLKYHVGDTIYYTMFMENTDVYPLVIEEISDVFSDLSPLTVDPPLGPGDTDDITLAPGDPGETQYFATEVEVTEGALYFDGMYWRVLNTANFIAYTQYPTVNDPSNKTETKSSIILRPDICVTKTVEPTISKVGSTVTYTIEICNCGDTDLTLTVLSDTLLPIDLANVPAEGLVLDGALLDESGNIIPDSGECTSFTYEYTIKEGDPVLLVNEVCVTGEDEIGGPRGTVTDCDIAVVELISPELTILKTVDCDDDGEYLSVDQGVYGDDGAWRIVVTNTGDSPLTNVITTDTNGQAYGPIDLAIGESVQYDYVTPGLTETTTNIATVTALDVSGAQVGPESSTAINQITIEPDIAIVKTVDCDGDGVYLPVDVGIYGDDGAWRIVVTNTGDSPLTNVITTDTNGQSYGPIDLAIGESVQYDYVTPGLTATTTNIATVVAEDMLGDTVGPESSTAINEILFPDTTVDITASDELVCEGDEVTLTICEANTGQVDLTNVSVDVSTGDTLVYPPDTDNGNGDNVLNPGENWCWSRTVIVDTTTTYGATGHGTGPAGNDITPPLYPLEYDEVLVEAESCGGEGCTPGFWKNNGDKHGASAWCDRFDPSDPISDHFSLNDPLVVRGKGKNTITNPTLLQALNANGGGVNAMIRHGVAAMLNACSDCVQYAIGSPDQVISMIEDTLNGVGPYTVGELHSMFAEANEAGCPVNQHGECVEEEIVIAE